LDSVCWGCLGLISGAIVWFAVTGFTGTGTDMAQLAMQFVFIAIWLVAAVVVMKLRQKME
jgi:Zn-dependent protease with chaperone function